jgi:hypothetical protein
LARQIFFEIETMAFARRALVAFACFFVQDIGKGYPVQKTSRGKTQKDF